jgi:hypothetical protein
MMALRCLAQTRANVGSMQRLYSTECKQLRIYELQSNIKFKTNSAFDVFGIGLVVVTTLPILEINPMFGIIPSFTYIALRMVYQRELDKHRIELDEISSKPCEHCNYFSTCPVLHIPEY